MKNKFLIVFLIFSIHFLFSQQVPRSILKGQIISETKGIENIKITNTSLNKFVVSDEKGFFYLYARPKDTLIFSSFSYVSKKVVLTDIDFKVQFLRIDLEAFINTLDEIIIAPNALTGILEIDQKNVKITQLPQFDVSIALGTALEDDVYSSPENKLMPGYLDTKYMMDFVAIAEKVFYLFKTKKKDKKVIFVSEKNFPEAVKEKFKDEFFINTLKLTKEEIGLFLIFCEKSTKSLSLLEPKKEFLLIDFLVSKRKDYALLKKE